MALSYAQSVGNGMIREFPVPFQYLSKQHVSVSVDGAQVSFSWLSGSLVRLDAIPANGAIIDVRRATPNDRVLVDFNDGSTLTETDLDTATLQSFFLAQESFDAAGGTLSVNADGSFSALNRRISFVADPVVDGDVATKGWARTILVDAEAIRAATEVLRAAAEASAGAAATSLAGANTARDKAQKWAENARNVAVETGKFSARHWASVAQEAAEGSASNISVVPVGGVSATTVQAAIAELDSEKVTTGALTAAVEAATTRSNLSDILGGWYEPDGFRITGAAGTSWMWEVPSDAVEWRLTMRGARPASGFASLSLRCGSAGAPADSGASDYLNQNIYMANGSFATPFVAQSAPTVFTFAAAPSPRRVVAEGTLGSANDIWMMAASVAYFTSAGSLVGEQFSYRQAVGRKPRLFLTSDVALVAGDFIVEVRN